MTRLLLVEDDKLLARQFVNSFKKAHDKWLVDYASHVSEAIGLIEQALPDVIVLDLILPVHSGISLLQELQSYDDTAIIPIVVCSSMADSLELSQLEAYGVKRLLDKTTMAPEDVVLAVEAVL